MENGSSAWQSIDQISTTETDWAWPSCWAVSPLLVCMFHMLRPACPQAREIECLYSWGNFKCCYKKYIFCSHQISQCTQLPDLFTPVEHLLYVWVDNLNSILRKSLTFPIIVILFSCFIHLFGKQTNKQKNRLSIVTWTEKRNPTFCLPIEMNFNMGRSKRFLSQQAVCLICHRRIRGSGMLWLPHFGTIRKNLFWYGKYVFS